MKANRRSRPKPIRVGTRVVCNYWSAALSCFSARPCRVIGTVRRIVRVPGRRTEYWLARTGVTNLFIGYEGEVKRARWSRV